MKKLIYICPTVFGNNFADGVGKKVAQQLAEMNKYFDTYLLAYDDNGILIQHNGTRKIVSYKSKIRHRRYYLYETADSIIKANDIKHIYIRYGYCDLAFLKLLKKINGKKVILEIATYPYDTEMNKSIKYRIFREIDQKTRNKMVKYVSKIATYSADKEIFSIPCINIMNGINVDNIKIKENIESSRLNLLALASMANWHGYDRLIEGLNDYYSNGGTKQIVLNLVGNGSEMPKYKQLTQKYKLENNVIFHGFKSGNDLDELYDTCDIAVECLGAHRKKLFLSSSLKSREYGAKGMPMVTSCAIDAFPSETCDYILKFPEDESHIEVEKIVLFYDDLLKKYKTAKNLAQTIRTDTRARCDISVVMKPVIDCFRSDNID